MKTVIVADLHGCCLEFRALMRVVQLSREQDTLLILGDLFDRGKQSYEVFREVTKLKEQMGERLIFVRGNHDQFLLDNLESGRDLSLWAYNGGLKTIESFKHHGASIREAKDLLLSAPLYYEEERFIGVHAGLKSERPEENDSFTLLWDRSVTEGGYKGKLAIGGHTPMREPVWFMPDGNYLILPYDKKLALPDRGFICIDTGCVFGGRLTAMAVEEDTFELKAFAKRSV